MGPTASGKTALSLEIARKFNGEIVSADSRQIYKKMDVGTAKPLQDKNPKSQLSNPKQISNSKSQKPFIVSGIPHYLIDIKNPDENYTVAEYKKDAIKVINKILKNGKLPILVGGTGLYVKAVIDNLTIPEIKPDMKFRKKIEKELKVRGLPYLYEKLIKLDPEAAYIIDRHNPRRVIRALEIIHGSGKLYSEQRKKGKKLFDTLEIGINAPKDKLREKIEKRVDVMIKNGLIQEVKNLLKKYPPETVAFDAIGYREIINYLKGKIAMDEAVEQIKKNTSQYAKRQITWFNKDKEIYWIKNRGEAMRLLREFTGKT